MTLRKLNILSLKVGLMFVPKKSNQINKHLYLQHTQAQSLPHSLSFSTKPSPDPNKRAHHMSKSQGGRISPTHALQGVTHKVFPPKSPFPPHVQECGRCSCMRVCVWDWGISGAKMMFLYVFQKIKWNRKTHQGPLTSLTFYTNNKKLCSNDGEHQEGNYF